jgi:hypothetical protein
MRFSATATPRRRGTIRIFSIPRLRALMAVASVMLLTVSFTSACRGQSGSTTSVVTASAVVSPVSAPLPQTVSTSGLRITLLPGSRDGNQVVLTFRIESADPAKPNLWALGGGELMGIIAPMDDIEVTGMRWNEQDQSGAGMVPVGPDQGTPESRSTPSGFYPTPDIAGYLWSIPYVLTGAPDQPVTVTVRRVRFENAPATPGAGRIISGAWRFAFVPATLPSPTPAPSIPLKP